MEQQKRIMNALFHQHEFHEATIKEHQERMLHSFHEWDIDTACIIYRTLSTMQQNNHVHVALLFNDWE